MLQAVVDGGQYLGGVALKFGENRIHAHAEHAGIPQVLTAPQVRSGSLGVGLFDEVRDLVARAGQWLAFFDVPKPGFRTIRYQAECAQPALFR
ncbi:hypothetical protein D9M71_603040 [compost metagenome]